MNKLKDLKLKNQLIISTYIMLFILLIFKLICTKFYQKINLYKKIQIVYINGLYKKKKRLKFKKV